MADMSAADLENIHTYVQEHFFKLTVGIKDKGLLDSIANRPNQRNYEIIQYPNIYSKAASIMEAIIRWHPFADGNKRTALLATSLYLHINGFQLIIPLSAVRFRVEIALEKETDPKSNEKLLRRITKWIKQRSARIDDPDEIRRVYNRRAERENTCYCTI